MVGGRVAGGRMAEGQEDDCWETCLRHSRSEGLMMASHLCQVEGGVDGCQGSGWELVVDL